MKEKEKTSRLAKHKETYRIVRKRIKVIDIGLSAFFSLWEIDRDGVEAEER
jgi:hypothetical protein